MLGFIKKYGLYIISILIVLSYTALILLQLDPAHFNNYFSSDSLFLQSIFKDVFIDKSGFAGWHLNAAPNFFPDMFFYFILNGLTGDFIISSFIYSHLQVLALMLLFGFMIRSVIPNISFNYLAVSNLMLIPFMWITTFTKDFLITFYLFSISYHTGAFLMSLLAFTLLFRILQKQSTQIALFIVVFLATMSDRLFVVMFIIPAITALIFIHKFSDRKALLRTILFLLLSALAGYFAFDILKKLRWFHVIGLSWKVFSFENILNSFGVFFNQHLTYLKLRDARGLMVALGIISIALLSIINIKQLKAIFRQKQHAAISDLFYFLMLVFILAVLFIPVINGGYVGWAMLRYNIFAFYIALMLFGVYAFRQKLFKKLILRQLSLSLIFLISLIPLLWKYDFTKLPDTSRKFFHYYPEYVAELDSITSKENIQYGVAMYWEAKMITMFSKANVRCYTVFPGLTPWYHVMNKNWYYKGGKGKFANPEFRFLYLNHSDTLTAINKLGQPEKRIACNNNYFVFVYPEFEFDKTTRRIKLLHAKPESN